MPGLQTWVNGWVNVNNRHVVYDAEEGSSGSGSLSGQSPPVPPSPSGSSSSSRRSHQLQARQSRYRRPNLGPVHEGGTSAEEDVVISSAPLARRRQGRRTARRKPPHQPTQQQPPPSPPLKPVHPPPPPPPPVAGDGRAILDRRHVAGAVGSPIGGPSLVSQPVKAGQSPLSGSISGIASPGSGALAPGAAPATSLFAREAAMAVKDRRSSDGLDDTMSDRIPSSSTVETAETTVSSLLAAQQQQNQQQIGQQQYAGAGRPATARGILAQGGRSSAVAAAASADNSSQATVRRRGNVGSPRRIGGRYRKLGRTNSQSDLLKIKAIEQRQRAQQIAASLAAQENDPTSPADLLVANNNDSSTSGSATAPHVNTGENTLAATTKDPLAAATSRNIEHSDNSLHKFVAGFFTGASHDGDDAGDEDDAVRPLAPAPAPVTPAAVAAAAGGPSPSEQRPPGSIAGGGAIHHNVIAPPRGITPPYVYSTGQYLNEAAFVQQQMALQEKQAAFARAEWEKTERSRERRERREQRRQMRSKSQSNESEMEGVEESPSPSTPAAKEAAEAEGLQAGPVPGAAGVAPVPGVIPGPLPAGQMPFSHGQQQQQQQQQQQEQQIPLQGPGQQPQFLLGPHGYFPAAAVAAAGQPHPPFLGHQGGMVVGGVPLGSQGPAPIMPGGAGGPHMGLQEEDYLRLVGHRSITPPYYHHPGAAPEALAAALPPPPHQPEDDNRRCPHCEEMERHLLALQSDLECLRTTAMRSEASAPPAVQTPSTPSLCAECGGETASHGAISGFFTGSRSNTPAGGISSAASVASESRVSVSSRTSRRKKGGAGMPSSASSVASADVVAGDASHRLVEASGRHKRQVEQMTRDTARWQNDMHLKLSKLSMMCKELNDESAQRKEDAVSSLSELSRVRAERNALATEVETLRARLDLYESEEVENDRIRAALRAEEGVALDRADDALHRRDLIISDLSGRFRRTMDTLEVERHQQRQRRQIIFPNARPHSYNQQMGRSSPFFDPLAAPVKSGTPPLMGSDADSFYNSSSANAGAASPSIVRELNEQLVRARDAARAAQTSLEVARAEANQRERALQARCELLARELHAAEEQMTRGSSSKS